MIRSLGMAEKFAISMAIVTFCSIFFKVSGCEHGSLDKPRSAWRYATAPIVLRRTVTVRRLCGWCGNWFTCKHAGHALGLIVIHRHLHMMGPVHLDMPHVMESLRIYMSHADFAYMLWRRFSFKTAGSVHLCRMMRCSWSPAKWENGS